MALKYLNFNVRVFMFLQLGKILFLQLAKLSLLIIKFMEDIIEIQDVYARWKVMLMNFR